MSNVFWITGLSSAGKTTLAKLLTQNLRASGKPVVMLDGDDLREALGATAQHSRDERLDLGYKYAKLARLIANQGVIVVVATVGLFKELHEWNRLNQPGLFVVYLRVTLDKLRRRDPKRIYARFDAGELSGVAGLDIEVDEPVMPHLIIENHKDIGPEQSLDLLLESFAAWQADQVLKKNS